jgi:hypothetical protein
MGATKPTQAFLKEYRDLCVKHGKRVQGTRDGELVVKELPQFAGVLLYPSSGCFVFISLDALIKRGVYTTDFIVLPDKESMEGAISNHDQVFRGEVAKVMGQCKEQGK